MVELAAAVGLVALPEGRLDPLGASTFGLGEVIADALDHGANQVVVGLGGSASTDGGAGMLQALGARVLDATGEDVGRGGAALLAAATLDLSDLHPAVAGTDFVLACDVDNPLLGPHGATAVYGPQKGADEQQLATLKPRWRTGPRWSARRRGRMRASCPARVPPVVPVSGRCPCWPRDRSRASTSCSN